MWHRLAALCLLLVCVPLKAQHSAKLSGTIKGGEPYTKDIGHGLLFAIRPIDGGYSIRIEARDSATESDSFSRCVTPPFHGPNPTEILAWQFADKNNERMSGPQLVREFEFVTNNSDQKKACDELSFELYGKPKSRENGGLVLGNPRYVSPPLGKGTFKIRNFELGDSENGKSVSFASLGFEVDLEMPNARKHKMK